jgi:hypothetical protein
VVVFYDIAGAQQRFSRFIFEPRISVDRRRQS